MDATTFPHRIPPEMPQYGQANHIFELMQSMLERLLIHQPEDPISFMIEHLQLDNDDVPKIVILGPPASGKTTIAMWLCKHLNCNLLNVENLMGRELSQLASEARKYYRRFRNLPSQLLVRMVQERLEEEDCVRRVYLALCEEAVITLLWVSPDWTGSVAHPGTEGHAQRLHEC